MAEQTYDTIDNPYGVNLNRSEDTAPSEATGVDPNAGGRTILSGSALTDAWIDTWIKSTNYEPKKRGFLIDGLKGYIEAMDLYVTGGIVGGSLNIPDTTTINSFHVDAFGNTWWGTNVATGYATAPAYVLNTGEAVFTDVTISGDILSSNITGGLITGATFQTLTPTTGIVLNSNDALFYDASTGGGGTIGGNTATVVFRRTDYDSGALVHLEQFLIQKRKSIQSNDGNVAEIFFDAVPAGGVKNYAFLGRDGSAPTSVSSYKTHIVSLAAKDQIQIGSSACNDNKVGWVIAPGPECQITEASLFTGGFGTFNAGGSRVWLCALESTISAPLDPLTLGGGGAVILGTQDSTGQVPKFYVDVDGSWLMSDLFPVFTDWASLGDPTHAFLDFYVDKVLINTSGRMRLPVGTNLYT